VSELLPNTLASYVPWLREADDEWRLRIVLHDFGLVWHDSHTVGRAKLVKAEPATVDQRWDAFLAAYVEHHCWHEGIAAPTWVFDDSRYLTGFWFPGPDLANFRSESIVHSPAAFEAHGVLLAARELVVV